MAAKRAGKTLDFPGGLTQLQWCATTLKYLEKECRKSKTPLTTEHQCVANLVEGLLSQCRESVQAVSLVLTEASSRGLVSGDSVILSLISSCASMHHWTLSIYTLAQLLRRRVLSSIKSCGSFTNPYSLRSSPLPFISIFNSKPESGLVISDVTIHMLKDSSDYFSGMLLLLTPLFKYMFLHPSPSSEHLMVSSYLHTSLLSLAESLSREEDKSQAKLLLQALTNLLPLSPTLNHNSTLTLINHIERLAKLWCMVGDRDMVVVTADACLALCCKLVGMSLSFDSLLTCLSELVRSPLKLQLFGHQIFCLSWLMFQSLLLPSTLNLILELVLDSLKLHPQVLSYLPVMILPLVQILSLPPSHHHHHHPSPQPDLQKSAHILTQAIQHNRNWSWKSERAESSRGLLGFQPYPMIKSLSDVFPVVLSTAASVETWLSQLSNEDQLSHLPSSSVELLALALSALLARSLSPSSGGVPELSSIVQALSTIAKLLPTVSPSLLPLILYFLPLAPSPSLKLALLRSLPLLATHKFSVSPTANVLRTLAGSPELLPVSLCLLGKLWAGHDSVYPHLLALLARPNVPGVGSVELEVARAVVIKDICCRRGEHHGEDMLSHISLILRQSRVPLAIALATDALATLSQCDTVDPVTVWSVFGRRLLNHDIVPAVVATCSLLSLAADVDSEQRHAAKYFKDSALRSLWKMVFSENPKVCSAALDGLSHFSMSDFLVEHLPPEAPDVQSVTVDPFAEDSEKLLLPARDCVDLVATITTESLPSLSRFLSSLLPAEVEAVPRGTISSVLRQAQVPGPLERAVRGAENIVRGICLANSERDSPYGMVASTSLMLNGMMSPTEQAEPRGRGGHAASKEMKKFSSLLEEALAKGRVCLDCDGGGEVMSAVSCLPLPRHWSLFMKKVCDSFTKVWLVRNCPASIWENSSALGEKIFKARDWAKKELVTKLSEIFKNSPKSSHNNILLSLVGVVCAAEFSPSGSEVETAELATPWSSTELLSLSLATIQSIICGLPLEPLSDSPTSALLSVLRESVDTSVFLLACPVLVETALALSSPTLFRALEHFALSLWKHLNESPSWYGGVVLNEVMVMMLPRMSQAESITTELVHFAKASLQSQSFEYLSVVSSLIPTLALMKHADVSLGVLSHLETVLQLLSSDQLAVQQPQMMSLNYVNSCRLLYLNGIISDTQAMQCVTHLADLATKAPQVAAYHFCLGSLMYGLMAAAHPTVQELADNIAVRWIQQLAGHTSPNELLVLVWGLAGLIGVNPAYATMWYKDELVPLTFVDSLFPLLRDILGKLSSEDRPVVGCHATWILGHIYYTLTTTLSAMERTPKDYTYLPEHSLLSTLLSHISNRKTDVRQLSCLLSALLSLNNRLPPCDLGSILFPLVKQSELQVTCVELLVKQSSLIGMKTLTRHLFNLMLTSCLMAEAELLLLENLSSLFPLLPGWKYLHPLTTSLLLLYPNSMKHLQSLLKGLKSAITVSSKPLPKEIVAQIWEDICRRGRITEMTHTQGKLLLKLLAECLAAVGYTPVPPDCSLLFLAKVSLPVTRTAFESLLQMCWVESGKCGVSNLNTIIHWTLQNSGLLDSGVLRAVMDGLVEVVRCMSSVGTPQKTLVIKTELLHSLLLWTRDKEASPSQMQWVLFLCVVVASPVLPGVTQSPSLHLEQWLASFSVPDAPMLQEKVLQCVVEWFAYSDEDVHKVCLSVLKHFTLTAAYNSPVMWTTAAHLL